VTPTSARLDPGHLDLADARRVLMISDLHLSPDFPQLEVLFGEFLNQHVLKHNAQPDALVILGDLFDYWIGDDAAKTIGQQTCVDTLRRVVDTGVSVSFLHGNRDFLVGDQFAAETGIRLLDPLTLMTVCEQRVALCHGDELCTDDVEHQEWRTLVLGEPWQQDFLAKGLDERQQFAEHARATSEQSKSVKSMEIMDVNLETVSQVMTQTDVRWMVHGHTHRPGVHVGDNTRVVLGDWRSTPSYLDISHGAMTLVAGSGRPGGTIALSARR